MIKYQIKNPETNKFITIEANRRDISYFDIINELRQPTTFDNVYINLNSIDEHGLGYLINPLDLFYGKISEMVPKINYITDKYIDGWVKINQYGINHSSEADENESRTIKITY